ncbi:phage major capsid protein [Hydrogenophaga sp.]|uniref:phage major capsid protein n=1 Tax=Hydrogenophaga sp. TaxID=1904254 RepID=UPI0025BB4505|nr:phage major capsid protein [Hydrogenophaga sp.]
MSTKPIPEALARHLTKGRAERALQVERQAINEEARTAVLAFASEAPYERNWGIEILDTTTTSMRLGRLGSGANLLCDHDIRDVVGVVESVEVGSDRVARAVVRFGKSARAEEVWQDVRDGIRRNVSVGYMIHKAQLVETKDGLETYRVTDWEPFEVSMVSVPADASVGVGRALEVSEREPPGPAPTEPTPTPTETPKEIKAMSNETIAPVAAPKIEVVEQRNHAAEITKVAAAIPGGAELAMKSIQAGHTVEQFQTEAIRAMSNKPLPTADIGMSAKETKTFSLVRLLNSMANPEDVRARNAAAFEIECARAAADKVTHREVRGLVVPHDILKRDLNVGTPTAGGNTVATNLLAGSFIDLLRKKMVLSGMGMQMMDGLVGNIAIPRLTGGSTAYWVAESAAPTVSQQTFDQVAMSPKTLAARTPISRKLLLQSSLAIEAVVQNDLATVLAQELQRVGINGSGSGSEPRGILNTVGIGSVAGGTNGLAPNWSHIVKLETAVAVANADMGSLAYLTSAAVRGKLLETPKVSGNDTFIWSEGAAPLRGYQAGVTNAVPDNLTKGTSSGVCSAIIFGNFADLMMGMWGGLELMVDPYTSGDNGAVVFRAFQDADLAVRHPESFAAMKDALTA